MGFQGTYSVSVFYTKLRTIWREIDSYGDTPHCDCGKCICNINGRISDDRDKARIRKFLMGLSEDFRQIRSTILSMDKLPPISKIYQMVTHEEAQQGLASHTTTSQICYAKAHPTKNTQPTLSSHAGKSATPQFYQGSSSQNPTPQTIRKRPPPPVNLSITRVADK